jgi:hypothetical protein
MESINSTLEGTECLDNREFHHSFHANSRLHLCSTQTPSGGCKITRNSVTFFSSWTSFNFFTRRRLSGSLRSFPWQGILEEPVRITDSVVVKHISSAYYIGLKVIPVGLCAAEVARTTLIPNHVRELAVNALATDFRWKMNRVTWDGFMTLIMNVLQIEKTKPFLFAPGIRGHRIGRPIFANIKFEISCFKYHLTRLHNIRVDRNTNAKLTYSQRLLSDLYYREYGQDSTHAFGSSFSCAKSSEILGRQRHVRVQEAGSRKHCLHLSSSSGFLISIGTWELVWNCRRRLCSRLYHWQSHLPFWF